MIPAEAVEAAAKAMIEVDPLWPDGSWENMRDDMREHAREMASAILEAAAPHMVAGMEWAIFRASDGPDGTPMENMRYKSREAAQRWIDEGFSQPEFWEVRGRAIGEWAK